MCWQCDHPGASWQDYLDHLRELLELHCWIVQGVQRARHRASYAYTIGLAGHDRPELVVTGMGYHLARPKDLPWFLTGMKAIAASWAELRATMLNPPGAAVIPSKCVYRVGALP